MAFRVVSYDDYIPWDNLKTEKLKTVKTTICQTNADIAITLVTLVVLWILHEINQLDCFMDLQDFCIFVLDYFLVIWNAFEFKFKAYYIISMI